MVAYANKDEALKCLSIARRALDAGDVAKGRKFGAKAKALYGELDSIDEFLEEVKRVAESGPARPSEHRSSADTASTSTASAAPSARHGSNTQDGNQAESRNHNPSTSDQQRLVKTIRSKKCHYEILMISKTANDDEIKRAYRKLALKLHPDKNKAPGADEAFKMVSKAFSVLSNPDDRAHYDRYGDREGMPPGARGFDGFRRGRGPQFGASFNGVEVDAEELFRMFFGGNPFMGGGFGGATFGGGGFGGARQQQQRYRRQQQQAQQQYRQGQQYQQQRHQQQQQSSVVRLLVSIAPIVMLLIFNLFSGSVSPYSLQQTREYPFPSTTSAHKVPFYVMDKNKFMKQYRPGSHERVRLEYEIEATFKEHVQRRCYQERLVKARYESYGQTDKASKASLASCELLDSKFSTTGR